MAILRKTEVSAMHNSSDIVRHKALQTTLSKSMSMQCIITVESKKEVRKALEPEVNSLRVQPSLGILKITSSCSLEINL